MKTKNILYSILLIGATIFAYSCEDNDTDRIVINTVEDGMHLSVNHDEITLSQDLMDETAVTFHWDKAQERANNGKITYYFKLGLPDFTTAIDKIKIEDGVFDYSFNHYDLNVLLYSKFGVPYGGSIELEAEIIASSDGDYFVKPEISTVKFTVTTFEISPINLYLVGTANPKGSTIENGIKLTEIIEGRDIGNKYEWIGDLQVGTFKFVDSSIEPETSWGMGSSSTELVKNSSVNAGTEFTVTKSGLYSIILNKNEREIIYGYKGFTNVWGVGLGIGIEWNMPSSAEFSWDPRNPSIFTLECTTQANQDFKLPYNDQSAGWGCPFLRPYNANANIWEDNRVQATPAGYDPDLKWWVTPEQAGDCILTIDAFNETITLVKK